MPIDSDKIRIGLMPYLNSEVFYHTLNLPGTDLSSMVPSAMARAADIGTLDGGPVPIVDCFRLEDRFAYVNGFCIATVERARSILLFSKSPIQNLDGKTIGITDETSTTVRLLKVLLVHKYGVRPSEYVSLSESSDAYLLIGDNALRNKGGNASYPCMYDLGEEWNSWTGLPFVFARWILRKTVPESVRQMLREQLDSSIESALRNVEHIASKRHIDLGLTIPETIEYVQSFRYVVGNQELQSIERFRSLLGNIDTP